MRLAGEMQDTMLISLSEVLPKGPGLDGGNLDLALIKEVNIYSGTSFPYLQPLVRYSQFGVSPVKYFYLILNLDSYSFDT